jgi:4'-phosphopantetheinyl transferase
MSGSPESAQPSGASSALLALANRRQLMGTTLWWADMRKVCAATALIAEDLAGARRWRRQSDRDRHLAARALLRSALSEEVRCEAAIAPKEWRFEVCTSGKPFIAAGLPPLEFSLSHSGNAVAAAIRRDGPVGVDIEELTPAGIQMIETVLSGKEKARISSLDPQERPLEFLSIWTTKEACAKALGIGIDLDFSLLNSDPDERRVTAAAKARLGVSRFAVFSTWITMAGRNYSLSLATPERREAS